MLKFANLYFSTFNLLYPLLDQEEFVAKVLPAVTARGFGFGDHESIMAFLVFALGAVAEQGTYAEPIEVAERFNSGIRGGSHSSPPGLDFFNEARRRLGFIAVQCTLEGIQVLLLAA